MTARKQAISDIKDDLKKQHKCFIAFHRELNTVMRQIVGHALYLQDLQKHKTNKKQ